MIYEPLLACHSAPAKFADLAAPGLRLRASEYQKKLVADLARSRLGVYDNSEYRGRQKGTTIGVAMFLLWRSLFHSRQTMFYVAPRKFIGNDVMRMVLDMYDHCGDLSDFGPCTIAKDKGRTKIGDSVIYFTDVGSIENNCRGMGVNYMVFDSCRPQGSRFQDYLPALSMMCPVVMIGGV